MQIERDAGGSIIAHWKPEQIKKLWVSILPKSTQRKIADLVHQSHQGAEVLVPDRINPGLIMGAYVSCTDAKEALEATGLDIPVTINSHLFFR
jgi:hypothetical protein